MSITINTQPEWLLTLQREKRKRKEKEDEAKQMLELLIQQLAAQSKIFMEELIELIIKCGNKSSELMHTAPTEQNTILAIIARQWKYAMTYVQTCLQKASEAIDATKLQHAMTCAQTCLEDISETIGATQALKTVTQYMSSQCTALMNMLTLGGSEETKPEKQTTGGSEETKPGAQPTPDTTEQSTIAATISHIWGYAATYMGTYFYSAEGNATSKEDARPSGKVAPGTRP